MDHLLEKYLIEIDDSIIILSKSDLINISALINQYDNEEKSLLEKGTLASFVVKHDNISLQKIPTEKQ